MGRPFRGRSAAAGAVLSARIAVTGASGFLGRHVVHALATRGAQVWAASRRPAPGPARGVQPVVYDIGDPGPDPLAPLGTPDTLLHLAWDGLPHYRSPHHLEVELPRQVAFLDACLAAGLPRLLVVGTCLEYGLQTGELDESAPLAPVTTYGEAKRRLHAHLEARRRERPFQLGWLRLFYLYGPGQAPTSLYAQLRAAIASGQPRFDMSRGDQSRDFQPVEHAAAQLAALALDTREPGTLNVCSGVPTTVMALVQRLRAQWGSDIPLNPGAFGVPDYEPHAFWGSTRRLAALGVDHGRG